jgi:hypothetical protein|tara:strand:+ start:1057 stop:1647 length:591 start_codon:yes stop_codon:yes gene_type:complete
MKKLDSISLVLLFAIILFSTVAFTTIVRAKAQPIIQLKPKPIVEMQVKITAPELVIMSTSHEQFLNAMGYRESTNNYTVVNKFGYMGRYQFGQSTLKGLGIKASTEEFINNPALQEYAMQELLVHNKKKLKRYIKKYEGQIVHGVFITESGILAAAHIGGAGNVRRFFRNGYEFKDGFGTKMTSYMKLFGGYNLNV